MPDKYTGDDTIIMLANLHLANNEIRTFRVQNISSDESLDSLTKGTGRLVFREGHLWLYDGEYWIQVGDSVILRQYQTRDEKDQPGGYLGIGEDGKVDVQFIPTGNYEGQLPILKGEIRDGQSIRFSDEAGGFVAFDIGTLYTFKGTCSSADLDLIDDPRIGDVWNLSDDRVWQGHNYTAGTSWAWEGTEWEPLAGALDLSGYQLISNMVSTMANPNGITYPSTIAVRDYVQNEKTPVITSWGTETDTSVPSSKLVKDSLDRKTDLTMAVPAWSESETYSVGSTVVRQQSIYISIQDANIDVDPLTDTPGDWWVPVQTASDLAVGSVRSLTSFIGNGTDTVYEIYHGFNTWNLFVTARTNASPSHIVGVVTEVIDANQVRIHTTSPPGTTGLIVTVMAVTEASAGDMLVYSQTEPANEWRVQHNFGTWAFVQVYSSDGNQLMADVVQSQDLNSVKIGFGSAKTGMVVLASAGSYNNETSELSGTGHGKVVKLGAARMLRLNEASGTWHVQHDKGRLVLVQVYGTDGDEIKADVVQDMSTLNSVTIRFSRTVSGTAVIL